MSITAPACASCVLGATSTSLLSFTYHTIETITVEVVPHITVYTAGSSTSRTTNYVSITQTATDIVGGGSGRNASKTFDSHDDLTWVVGDTTLTYPTTYVQYLGFAGAPASSDEKCASGADATALELPASTAASAFIYPLTSANAQASSLPEPLLQYLQDQAPFAAQFSGQALTGCAGLDYVPPETSSGAPSSSASKYSSAPKSVSALSSIFSSSSSAVPTYSSTSSSWSNQTFTATRPGHTVEGTTKIRPGRPTDQTPGPQAPSSSAFYGTPSSAAYSSKAPGPKGSTRTTTNIQTSPSPPQYSSPAETTNSHTTAFVIQPVTAQNPIITTLPADTNNKPGNTDNPHHTTSKGGNGPPGGYPDNPDTTTDGSGPTRTPGGHPDGHQVTPVGNNQGPGKPHHVYTVGTSKVTANPRGPITVGGKTLHEGDTVTLGHGSSATTVALEGHGKHKHLVVNGETQTGELEYPRITGAPALVSSGVITFNDGHKITAISSHGSIVLQDGTSKTTVGRGVTVTFDGQTIKIPQRGGIVTVNGDHVPLTAVLSSQAVITAGSNTLTAVDSGRYVVFHEGSSTIRAKDGSQTTFEGHTISVGPSGSAVVVDGKTATLSAAPTPEAVITAGGHTVTALDMSSSVILEDGSSTAIVRDGRTIVFEGQTFSIPSHGTAVVVNGKTVTFTTEAPTTSTGVGDYVVSGLGGSTTPRATATPASLADTNAAASAGLTAVAVRWSALLAALGALLVV